MELKAVHSSDAGDYQCCAANHLGTACTNFTLAVNSGIYQCLSLLLQFSWRSMVELVVEYVVGLSVSWSTQSDAVCQVGRQQQVVGKI